MRKKHLNILAVAFFMCSGILLTSCASEPEHNAESVHVDSSNQYGTAPVRYGADNPADTSKMSETDPSDDTGRRSNTEQR
ncbi:MAG: hypothetical protein WC756_20065 [Taibaiella sp.]|jgi:hypothetical protein